MGEVRRRGVSMSKAAALLLHLAQAMESKAKEWSVLSTGERRRFEQAQAHSGITSSRPLCGDPYPDTIGSLGDLNSSTITSGHDE